MSPLPSISNLNARLSAKSGAQRDSGGNRVRLTASPIQGSAPPVRIVGAARRYQGGYRVNV